MYEKSWRDWESEKTTSVTPSDGPATRSREGGPRYQYRKFELSEAEIRDLLDGYLVFVEAVGVTEAPGRERVPQCRDPDDQVFLDLAHSGQADVVVTGDSDRLSLTEHVSFVVETPAKFKKRFEDRIR